MYVRKGSEFTVSLGNTSAVIKADGAEEWQKVKAELTSDVTDDGAKLTIKNTGSESADIDCVSLMPQDTYKGHGLRRDLCEAIEAIHPKFLRFPGGCAVEGRTMDLAYNWKDTVGDISQRKQTENIWNTGSEPYIMSYGLGFYEYFQLCEDMGMEPVPILNCGIACQVRSGSSEEEAYLVPMDELQPYIQDAIDLVQFANGTDMTNKWAKLRADMGHPEPFNLKYLGIGNEQYGDIYFERYEAFAKALREAYPDMELNLVTTSGTASSGSMNDLAWSWVNAHNEYADVLDEHYYENPDWFREHAYRYDSYNRDTTKVFLGEYASKGNTWYNALSEAAFMTGLERNADVVRMASYAPMFAKYGNTQWTAANMIWFNNDDYVCTPNYYVQKLFGNNSGDYSLDTTAELNGVDEKKLSGGIALGAWNSQVEYKDIKVTSSSGEVLVNSFDGWENNGGEWSVNGDTVTESEIAERCIFYLDGDYSDYTMEVKARRTGGIEGFQVGVAGEDYKNYYRVNIGGWSNTATKLQKITEGTAELVSNTAEGNINTDVHVKDNEWQDIKVVVTDDTITAYLDGELACSYTKPKDYGTVYASSVYDESSDEIILKLVNTADADLKINVNINNVGYIAPDAEVTTMSADPDAVNTLENKEKIVPEEIVINNAGRSFIYDAAARSFSVIRLKKNSLKVTEPGAKAEYYDESGVKHEINMSYDESGMLSGVYVN
jgi:alpha-L-arabinofuranosidase